MIFAVIDTNVLVSALLARHPGSNPVRVVEAVLDGRVVPLHAPDIIDEYRDVLSRPEFSFDPALVEAVIAGFLENGRELPPAPSAEYFPDPSDKVFYCVALGAQEDRAKLVTGNKRRYPAADFVVTPAEFCTLAGL